MNIFHLLHPLLITPVPVLFSSIPYIIINFRRIEPREIHLIQTK